jgi:hypothetical protein
MNKKYLRTELREYKFEVWGLNYNLGVTLVKKMKELEVWWFNWTRNCLINEIRDPIVKC